MSLSISSSLPSLFVQQSLTSSGNQSSSESSVSNMDDTYTPSSDSNSYWNATESAIHQVDKEVQVNVSTALSAQSDTAVSNVLDMFGI
jgi:hypothetical protein